MVAAAVIATIIACFAEVASRFGSAGGPYLYAHEAFGRFVGIQVGWLTWLVRLTATAAAANLLLLSLKEFRGFARNPLWPQLVVTGVIILLAGMNIYGVGLGERLSTAIASVKLTSLLAFAAGGICYIALHAPGGHAVATVAPTARDWFEAVLLLMFAFGGFEAALIPMGEARCPSRDAPFALICTFFVVTFLFTSIQWVVVRLVSNAAGTERPLAEAARQFWGSFGAYAMAIAAMLSVGGYLAGQMLAAPRLTFALAERGEFPAIFAAVHPRFRTPYVSIVVFAAATWALAIGGSFRWNVALSAVARLFTYAAVCASLPVLRARCAAQPPFRLPAGPLWAALGICCSALLVTRMGPAELLILLTTGVIAMINLLLVRHRGRVGSSSVPCE